MPTTKDHAEWAPEGKAVGAHLARPAASSGPLSTPSALATAARWLRRDDHPSPFTPSPLWWSKPLGKWGATWVNRLRMPGTGSNTKGGVEEGGDIRTCCSCRCCCCCCCRCGCWLWRDKGYERLTSCRSAREWASAAMAASRAASSATGRGIPALGLGALLLLLLLLLLPLLLLLLMLTGSLGSPPSALFPLTPHLESSSS